MTKRSAVILGIAFLAAGIQPALSARAATSSATAAGSAAAATHWLPGIVSGDEAIAVTEHRIQTAHGPLEYEARAGRLPIRSQETGEVHGYAFFVAYVVKPTDGKPRPVTFIWNGGPTLPADFIHLDGMGPRHRTKDGMVDNPDTPLATSDLVFYDPIGTGFSRLAKPEFAPEFYNLQGDVATVAEFIRVYRTRFHALDQPLFICGESYGVFRAASLADYLTERSTKLAGVILVSGDIPNIPQSVAFYDAMHVPARTATAFHHHLLPADLLKDRDATMKQVNEWVVNTYRPALERIDALSAGERDQIATDLARYTGIRPEDIDRKTLVVHINRWLELVNGPDENNPIFLYDSRRRGDLEFGSPRITGDYMRNELGYDTDLTYNFLEHGYTPTPGHPARSTGEQFDYNAYSVTAKAHAQIQKDGEVADIARVNPPWIVDAIKREKTLQVFVSTGRYDLENMCEGDVIATATLPADLSKRIENHCYEAGHITYQDDLARPKFLGDISGFIRKTVALQSADSGSKKAGTESK
jgi:hypothetical protein